MKLKEIAKVKTQFKKDRKELLSTLKEVKTVKEIKGKWFLRQYITPATNCKDLTLKELNQAIVKIYDNRKVKELIKEIAFVESIFNAGIIKEIRVSIEWKKNYTWNANPTATVEIYGDNYEHLNSGSIGGCGYCKESTAFAQAINQSLAIRKLLIKGAKKIEKDYGHRNGTLSGGVGVSCYYRIFEHLGYKMTKVASGKMFDAWHVIKN